MKALIVYDSLYGNTQKIAEVISKTLNGQLVKVADFKDDMLKGIDLMVVGSPINGWKPSPGTINFLNNLSANIIKDVKIASFETRINIFLSGSAADKILNKLKTLGGLPLDSPKKFVVKGTEGPLAEGELEEAQKWAEKLKGTLKAKFSL